MELQRWRKREVLSGAEAKRSQRVCGHGGHRLLTLLFSDETETGRLGCHRQKEESRKDLHRAPAERRALIARSAEKKSCKDRRR
jgi:hypothetical protein